MASIRIWLAALCAAVFVSPCAAAPLEAYGHLPSIEQMAISPNGEMLAIAYTQGEQRMIVLQNILTKKMITGLKTGTSKIRNLQWAGNDHLIITASSTSGVQGLLAPRSEWFIAEDFTVSSHRQKTILGDLDMTLNAIGGLPIVRTVNGKPTIFVEGDHFNNEGGYFSLFQVNLDYDGSSLVTDGFPQTGDYLVSADGKPLAETEYDARFNRWTLKVWRDGLWREVEARRVGIETPDIAGLGRDGKSILVGDMKDGGYALRELSPDGATLSDPLPIPENSSLIHDPVSHRLIGYASLFGNNLQYSFFDPADQQAWNEIAAAFPGDNVGLESWSDDRRKVVIQVDSRLHGPGYALVDLNTHSAVWLGFEYRDITDADIGPAQPVWFKAADGLALTGYLTLPPGREAKNLPLVVFPHGGPAARDDPEFDWWAQAMASRGYAVLQVNYRGSAGFGWDFMSAGFGQWGQKMQTDLSDGVRYLASQGTIDPKRVCIVGASYGGYAALAGATLDTGVYRCAVDVSGPAELGKFIAQWKDREGDAGIASERYWRRYMAAANLADPHLVAISPADHADKVTIPILIIHGTDDTVVPYAQSQIMADALTKAGKPFEFVTLKSEDHWLSRSETRLQMLQATVVFLEKNNPPD